MKLHEIKPAPGSRKRKKIVGRGEGSGHGVTATRGMKGQSARSGASALIGFEGGQMPLIRRIPKRGFNHRRFKIKYNVVNIEDINSTCADIQEVTPIQLVQKGLVRKNTLVKILGDGDLTKALVIKAHSFSKSAEEKIKKAGGTIEVISATKPLADKQGPVTRVQGQKSRGRKTVHSTSYIETAKVKSEKNRHT